MHTAVVCSWIDSASLWPADRASREVFLTAPWRASIKTMTPFAIRTFQLTIYD